MKAGKDAGIDRMPRVMIYEGGTWLKISDCAEVHSDAIIMYKDVQKNLIFLHRSLVVFRVPRRPIANSPR
jgi:hypothetical protein